MATLSAYRAPASAAKGALVVGAGDRIIGFREKDPDLRGSAWINAGLMVIERRLTQELVPGEPADFGLDVIPSALAKAADLRLHRLPAPVLDIGTPEALARVQRYPAT